MKRHREDATKSPTKKLTRLAENQDVSEGVSDASPLALETSQAGEELITHSQPISDSRNRKKSHASIPEHDSNAVNDGQTIASFGSQTQELSSPTPPPRRLVVLTSTPTFLKKKDLKKEALEPPIPLPPNRQRNSAHDSQELSSMRHSELNNSRELSPMDLSTIRRSPTYPLQRPPLLNSIHPRGSTSEAVKATRQHDNSSSFIVRPSELDFLNSRSGSSQSVAAYTKKISGSDSLAQIISSRSSLATPRVSLSTSTIMEPLDLSPILPIPDLLAPKKKSKRKITAPILGKGNQQGVPPDRGLLPEKIVHGNTIELPLRKATADEDGNSSREYFPGGKTGTYTDKSYLKHYLSTIFRSAFVLFCLVFFISLCFLYVSPLAIFYSPPKNYMFSRYSVNTIAELHSIYRIPYGSLSRNETKRLLFRALSEGVERLDRSIHHALWSANDLSVSGVPQKRSALLGQIIYAYYLLYFRVEQYAKSREASSMFHHYVGFPLHDVLVFSLIRHGWYETFMDFSYRLSFFPLWDRFSDALRCYYQNEYIPCPSMTFLVEAMQRDYWHFIDTSSNRKDKDDLTSVSGDPNDYDFLYLQKETITEDWENPQFLRGLLGYLKKRAKEKIRVYNH